VFFNDLRLLVLVASITAVLAVCRFMAHLALHCPLITMIDREFVALQLGRIPASCAVAILTFEPKIAFMDMRFKVAANTLLRCPVVNLPHVASLAIDLDMPAIQWEVFRMLKALHPVNAIMAIKAVNAELQLMLIDKFHVISCMTFDARLRGKFLEAVWMAAEASYGCTGIVLAVLCQIKTHLGIMVEWLTFQEGWFPGFRIMARLAIQCKRTHMSSWFNMTSDTLSGHISKLALDVAIYTAYLQM
jgi:hypothetical protein